METNPPLLGSFFQRSTGGVLSNHEQIQSHINFTRVQFSEGGDFFADLAASPPSPVFFLFFCVCFFLCKEGLVVMCVFCD